MSEKQRLKVLVLTLTPVATDARVLRQVKRLMQDFDVTTASYGDEPGLGIPHIQLRPAPMQRAPLWKRLTLLASQILRIHPITLKLHPAQEEARKALAGTEWDLIFSNDVIAAPITNTLKSRFGFIADLHEYAPRQGEHSWKWRAVVAPLMRWICRNKIAGKAAAVTTIGQGIADEYKRKFGIEAELVINATPEHAQLKAQPVDGPIKLVHSGIPGPARKLEVMIDAVKQSSAHVTLDLFLMKRNFEYLDMLQERAKDDDRIHFRDPVPYDRLVETLNAYDVGVSMIAPTTFNLKWCLPNKFFDFVQGKLGIITGPSPEMKRYIEAYGFGAVSSDFTGDSLAKVIDNLTPEAVMKWKEISTQHAHELSGETQAENWAQVAHRVTQRA
jgi:hypothetical protein